ncbi:tetratricopeptide repeat protein, partial [Geitlerinema sp. P-1104]|nr:tetratricopeptide repeat protein [Geitlerinema sp. P-1104]
MGNLGVAYGSLGQYERAIDFFEQHLEIAREIGDRAGEGRALGNLGNVHNNLGQYERAIDFFEQSLVIAREIGDRAREGGNLGNLGNAYSSLGQYERAIDFYEQSLVIAREIGNRAGEGRTLGNLGVAYYRLGQYERALEQYGQAVALLNELGARSEEALFLSNIGRLLNHQAQPELAITFLKASVDIREAIRGDIRGLDTDLQQSFTDTVADSYRLLADLLLQQNRILEAQRVLDLLKVQELDEALSQVRSTQATSTGVAFWQIETDLLALYEQTLADGIALARLDDQVRQQGQDSLTPTQRQQRDTLRQRYQAAQGQFAAFLNRPEVTTLLRQIRQQTDGQSIEIERQHRTLQNNLRNLPQPTALIYPLILPDRLEL